MLHRITSIRIFVEATTLGSLSAAGRFLGMLLTMATKHMDAIEALLGVKLLHRITRRQSLTDSDKGYLEPCRRILRKLDEEESEVAALLIG